MPRQRKAPPLVAMLFRHPNITDLRLSFARETMFGLKREQFKQLSMTGDIITDFAPAKDYWIDEDFSRLFLSFDTSLSGFYFEYEPEEDMDKFIENSYVTHFFPKTGKIKLIKDFDRPLHELLLNKQNEINDIPTIGKEIFSEEQKVFLDELNEDAIKILLTTGNIKGQIACCKCGEAGCSSQYLWAKDYVGLTSFHSVGAALRQVRLFPFQFA